MQQTLDKVLQRMASLYPFEPVTITYNQQVNRPWSVRFKNSITHYKIIEEVILDLTEWTNEQSLEVLIGLLTESRDLIASLDSESPLVAKVDHWLGLLGKGRA